MNDFIFIDTENMEKLLGLAVDKSSCPRCEAKPKNACTTLAGRKTAPHSPRYAALLEAYRVGRDAFSAEVN